jgi:hypothetical protein
MGTQMGELHPCLHEEQQHSKGRPGFVGVWRRTSATLMNGFMAQVHNSPMETTFHVL